MPSFYLAVSALLHYNICTNNTVQKYLISNKSKVYVDIKIQKYFIVHIFAPAANQRTHEILNPGGTIFFSILFSEPPNLEGGWL